MEEKFFKAARLSEGNKLFPAEIHIEDNEIMLKIPGFFSGKSRHIVYQQIEGVNIDTPMIGYSTITFVVGGERIVAHGFTKNEAKEIKQICSNKISANGPRAQSDIIASAIADAIGNTKSDAQFSIADELKKLKELLDIGVLTQSEFNEQKSNLLNN
ncbi:hypothetical protein BH11BAC4_BH11BAC4_13940 [soil metagenome]